jgi:CubicO group peptidase (beta-lactamase class C family)
VLEATAPVAQGSFLALDGSEHPPGYGYQIWLMPGPRRTFYLDGYAGQRIFIDPASKLVLVHTAVRRSGDPRGATLVALWESLLAQVGQN